MSGDPLEHIPPEEVIPAVDADREGRPFPNPEHSLTPRKPRTVGGVVYLLVLATTAVGLALVVLDEWRLGLTVMGSALLAGAVGRLVLRNEQAGMLGLRRKLIDVSTLAVLGSALVVLAVVIADRPAP